MILIDTSIWVRSTLAVHINLARHVRELLQDDVAAAHDFIHGELLLGRAGKVRTEVVELYARLKRIEACANDVVVAFVKKHKIENRGVGWVDAHLLCAAYSNDAKLWTGDKAAHAIARDLKIDYVRTGAGT